MNQTNTVSAPRTKTYEITMTALMAAVTCILAPLSIPIGPVPISFTNLAIYLSLYLLGWKKGTISYLIYLLLGLVFRYFPDLPAALQSWPVLQADTSSALSLWLLLPDW